MSFTLESVFLLTGIIYFVLASLAILLGWRN